MTSVTASSLSAVNGRRIAAIVGAIVADAAAQPLHWVYNMDTLKTVTENVEEIEFREPSANPFYRIPTGSNTCYGDQAFVMLKSLVDSKGLSIENLKKETYEAFGPESPYENQENKEDNVNLKKTLPINTPWRHGCIEDFLSNMDQGLKETGRADMLTQVEKGLQVTQSLDLTVASALALARVLEQFILQPDTSPDVLQRVIASVESRDNANPQEMDKAVTGQIRRVTQLKDTPHFEVVNKHFKND